MKYLENEHAYILDMLPYPPVIAGFTKPNLKGDLPADMTKALAFARKNLEITCMKQLHGSVVMVVEKPGMYECDGLFTRANSVALVVRTADCMPLIFYSEKENMIGVVHVGWRSAKEGILDKIDFGLSTFLCVAGVGIRKCCYKVEGDFFGYYPFKPFLESKDASHYFDPIGFIRERLIQKGLKEENFLDLEICSYCSEYGFYSFRKTATPNRTLSFIVKNGN